MQRAGAAAASELALRERDRLAGGVLVFAGPGNNGGDAWVVARALADVGVSVRVVEPVPAKTDDARAERALAEAVVSRDAVDNGEALVIDGLLGTGASGAPRGEIAVALEAMGAMRRRGAFVAALDVPSGPTPGADLTLTFGTFKREHLLNRDRCGAIVVLDIGLGQLDDGAPCVVDQAWVAASIPTIAADAHKGARKKLAVIGGAKGMAGAAMLAARAALRSGIGMVKLVVAPESLGAVQQGEPYALASVWSPETGADLADWADAIVIGPGLGTTPESRAFVERILGEFHGPALLDADALNVFAGDVKGLSKLIGTRAALITPHPLEMARLIGEKEFERFEIGAEVARELGAAVLLKGVPTVVSAPDGRRLVSAAGTPALATAGSGDVLSGIAGTLLAQTGDPLVAGAAGAWIHGHAAEISTVGARGAALDDVVSALRHAWRLDRAPLRYPVLAELPAVGDDGSVALIPNLE